MNPIIIQEDSIAYYPVPKVACTSIKEGVYESVNGCRYDRKKMGVHIHTYYQKLDVDVSKLNYRLMVVRDPVKRFLSAFSNRVTHHKELGQAYINGLKSDFFIPIYNPGLGQFIDGIEDYRKVPTINHHICPITEIYTDIDYSEIQFFCIEKMDEFVNFIFNKCQKKMTIGRTQTGGKKYNIQDLSRHQIEFLIDFYKEDYEILGKFYSIDALWRAYRNGISY